MRRVVITGMGALSPLGAGLEHNWSSLLEGKHGFSKITAFDVDDLPSKIAAQVPLSADQGGKNQSAINLDDWVSPKDQRKSDLFITGGIIAATMAVEDSGWLPEDEKGQCRTGIIIGSGIGGLNSIYENSRKIDEQGARRISPFFLPGSLINLVSGQVSIKYGFKGPNHSVVTACATGAHAIGDACRLIKYGDADVMVAGGTEFPLGRLGVAAFSATRALSTGYNDTPEAASRPWDEGRDGFVIGEGAGVLVLEELEHAKRRNARIYAEVKGYGLSGDAYHVTAPAEDGDGGFRAMQAALRDASCAPEDIDYVNAHGTSTPLGDVVEIRAIRRLMGAAIDKVSISSTKSAIGHLLGAAGAMEAIYSTLAICHNAVPPTRNLDNPVEEAAGLDLVPHLGIERQVRNVMSNSFGFGGTNVTLVIGKVD